MKFEIIFFLMTLKATKNISTAYIPSFTDRIVSYIDPVYYTLPIHLFHLFLRSLKGLKRELLTHIAEHGFWRGTLSRLFLTQTE